MNFKKINHKLHIWIGLPASIIAFFICLSGSLFVFVDEIITFTTRDISNVAPQEHQVTMDEIVETIQKAYPNHIIMHSIIYKAKDKAALVVVGNKKTGMTYVYVNPYTGQIIGQNKTVCFFSKIAHFHKQLLLHKTGAWIILIASLFFVIELITGLIIWWPKNKTRAYFKKSLTIKSDAKPLRRMIDLHRVFGLYFLSILFLLSVTGVVLFFLPHQGIEAQKHNKQSAQINNNRQALKLEELVSPLMQNPDVSVVKTELWNLKKTQQIQCVAGTKIGVVTFTGTPCLIDKYTGEKFTDTPSLQNLKTRNIIRKLHVGDWLGWFGKLVSFLCGLSGSFLAVSGIIIWGKKRL